MWVCLQVWKQTPGVPGCMLPAVLVALSPRMVGSADTRVLAWGTRTTLSCCYSELMRCAVELRPQWSLMTHALRLCRLKVVLKLRSICER